MRRWVAVLAASVAGCVHVERVERVEKGPLLRTHERRTVVEGGLAGDIEVAWPKLTAKVARFQLCRTEQVDEYAEEHVTERSVPSAGPALGMGVSTTLVGGGLLAARSAFSAEPNRSVIDESGHFGPSSRELATAWSIGLLTVGVPALVVGLWGAAHSGEEVEVRKSELVVGVRDERCERKPAAGSLALVDGTGRVLASASLQEGVAGVEAGALAADELAALVVDGQPVELGEESWTKLHAFEACAHLSKLSAAELQTQPTSRVRALFEEARRCRAIENGPGAEATRLFETELERRRTAAELPEGMSRPGPRIESFEDALAAYSPTLRWTKESPDLARASEVVGQPVYLAGILTHRVEPNIAVVQVGAHPVLVFIAPEELWSAAVQEGSRVEAVAVVMGEQTLGKVSGPLVRAVWLRPAL
ncbi:MAG: hypothetical protein ACOZIN_00085 [Myxococcota bacterium]